MGRFKNIWESNINYYITTLSLFHFFRNSKDLEISSGNVNASVFTFQYSQIDSFSCRKEFLETLCKCIYLGF